MNWLPNINRPFIAFDWDGTLSVNSVTIMGQAQLLIEYLENELGYLTVVVTGRHWDMPHITTHDRVVCMHMNPNPEKYRKTFNPFRFKLWVLSHFYKEGRGNMLFYVDNDSEIVSMCRSKNIPVVPLGKWSRDKWLEITKYWVAYFIEQKRKTNK